MTTTRDDLRSAELDEQNKPGSMGCHELLHMTSLLIRLVEEEIYNHPAIKNDPEWKDLAIQAQESLEELYQRIGMVHI